MTLVAAVIEVGPNMLAVLIALIALTGNVATMVYQARTRREFKPNGGSSMRDAIDRIEKHNSETTVELAKLPRPQDIRDINLGGPS